METQLDKIISFAKEKQQTDVNSHRGAYQTIIDYCQALCIHDVGQNEQEREHCTLPGGKDKCNYKSKDLFACVGLRKCKWAISD